MNEDKFLDICMYVLLSSLTGIIASGALLVIGFTLKWLLGL